MDLFAVLFGLAAASIEASELVSLAPADLGAAVFKLSALDGTGKVKVGSAVLIAPGKLLTTCHVARDAESLQVHRGDARLTAKPDFVDIEHDLCVLSAPDLLESVPAEIAIPGDLKVGDEVLAVGYPRGGKLALSKGRLKALHRYGAVRVLQVSAPFDQGQSGGALFNSMGRLVGITAFKTVSGGDFHFALAFDGSNGEVFTRQANVPDGASHKTAFWERARHAQPLFLRAASLEADRDWKALLGVAQEWTASDATNSASWFALSRALSSLKRERDADLALVRAEALIHR
ncbi:MAG TPA: serine protease [Burkholderiales bacterium]|nr:serine protease [Burkholderiales bacterium]